MQGTSGHDIGTKQQFIHLDSNGLNLKRGGVKTIEFAASHDDGPVSWNAMEHSVEKKIDEDDFLRNLTNMKKMIKMNFIRFS
jgi:hypothetical protein